MNIWQRLAHRFFGWHYVNTCVDRQGWTDYHSVDRVYFDGDGRPFIYRYGMSHVVYIAETTEYRVDPLTFPRAVLEMSKGPADVLVLPRRRRN
jgi:hypothetical protein